MTARGWPLLLLAVACATPADRPASPVTAPPGDPAVAPPDAAEPEPEPPPPAPLTLEDPDGALAPLYAAMARAAAGAPDGRVLIAQFGDSHTAGDHLTGRLRTALQARLGDGGRGFVLPGRPDIKHYYLRHVRYGNDGGGWKAHQGGRRGTEEPYGLAGVRSFADRARAEAWVQTCDGCDAGTAVARFEVFFLRRAGAGALELRVDDGPWQRVETGPVDAAPPADSPAALPADSPALPAPVHDVAVVEVPDGPHRLTLRPAGDGRVDVFGVALERPGPGVVVDALGIVGLQMSHLWRWDWGVIGPQLARRAPALVVLQYGTNEVDAVELDVARFEQRYVELIGRVRAAVPGAAILVLGPPDLAVRARDRATCRRLAERQARDRARRERRLRAGDPPLPPDPPPEGCAWQTPPRLLELVEAERRAARRARVAFFDSLAALGGPGRIDAMVAAEPPLAYGDHVHFTPAGYAAWADLLLEDLLRGAAVWENSRRSGR